MRDEFEAHRVRGGCSASTLTCSRLASRDARAWTGRSSSCSSHSVGDCSILRESGTTTRSCCGCLTGFFLIERVHHSELQSSQSGHCS